MDQLALQKQTQGEIMKAYKFRVMAFVDRTFWLWLGVGSIIIFLSFR